MAKLVICQGLPASGKSTWAKAQVGYVRVSKDDIRNELKTQGWEWSPENEKRDVIPARDMQIKAVLSKGGNVISDDTNFAPAHIDRLQEIAANYQAEVSFMWFDTPVEECVKRDALRPHGQHVGEGVIREMAARYLPAPTPAPYTPDPTLPKAIICDLDGTLAINNGHRSFYDASTSDEDALCEPIANLLDIYAEDAHYAVIYCSGRFEKDRGPTLRFLEKHHCPVGLVLMRKDDDARKDAIVKRELFDAHIRGKYYVEFVLDDRNQVVDMWRELGLKCLQVADGDF